MDMPRSERSTHGSPTLGPQRLSRRARRSRRRHDAVGGVLAEVLDGPDSSEPVIAMRTFGRGCLALAVAGPVDRETIARLRALFSDRHIRDLSSVELVVDVSGVRAADPGLVRLLHRVRSRRGVEGCRVELRVPTQMLDAELDDATLAEAFTIYVSTRNGAAPAG